MQRATRLQREIKQMHEMNSNGNGIYCWFDDKIVGLDTFHASIIGQQDTPYEGGIFELSVTVPERYSPKQEQNNLNKEFYKKKPEEEKIISTNAEQYPFEPPQVQFSTPIYHPNIDTAGRICLDILKMPPKGSWKPIHNISTILKSIQVLMAFPNADDPLMPEISTEYKNDLIAYTKHAKKWTLQYAYETKTNKATAENDNLVITNEQLRIQQNGNNQTLKTNENLCISRPSKKQKIQ